MSIEERFKAERYRSCLRKKRYMSPSSAKAEAEAVARRSGREMYAYHCIHCKRWHLASQEKEETDV